MRSPAPNSSEDHDKMLEPKHHLGPRKRGLCKPRYRRCRWGKRQPLHMYAGHKVPVKLRGPSRRQLLRENMFLRAEFFSIHVTNPAKEDYEEMYRLYPSEMTNLQLGRDNGVMSTILRELSHPSPKRGIAVMGSNPMNSPLGVYFKMKYGTQLTECVRLTTAVTAEKHSRAYRWGTPRPVVRSVKGDPLSPGMLEGWFSGSSAGPAQDEWVDGSPEWSTNDEQVLDHSWNLRDILPVAGWKPSCRVSTQSNSISVGCTGPVVKRPGPEQGAGMAVELMLSQAERCLPLSCLVGSSVSTRVMEQPINRMRQRKDPMRMWQQLSLRVGEYASQLSLQEGGLTTEMDIMRPEDWRDSSLGITPQTTGVQETLSNRKGDPIREGPVVPVHWSSPVPQSESELRVVTRRDSIPVQVPGPEDVSKVPLREQGTVVQAPEGLKVMEAQGRDLLGVDVSEVPLREQGTVVQAPEGLKVMETQRRDPRGKEICEVPPVALETLVQAPGELGAVEQELLVPEGSGMTVLETTEPPAAMMVNSCMDDPEVWPDSERPGGKAGWPPGVRRTPVLPARGPACKPRPALLLRDEGGEARRHIARQYNPRKRGGSTKGRP